MWVGYLLISPVRGWFQNPRKILSPYVREGMKVLDVGCGMGFFSLPLAEMVGPEGKVICVDVQEGMIKVLRKRAEKANLSSRIEARLCTPHSLGIDDLQGEIDFILAFAVVHEVPHPSKAISELTGAMKKGGSLLLVEPKGHVSEEEFKGYLSLAQENSLREIGRPKIRRGFSALLQKP